MAKKYPRYCRDIKGALYYQRDFPLRLYRTFGKKTFTTPLGIKSDSVKEDKLLTALAKASEEFELKCRTMEHTDPALYSENEMDTLVEQALRKLNWSAGAFIHDENFYHYAEKIVPGLEDALDGDPDRPRTVEELVAIKTYRALEEAVNRRPKLLSALWSEYCGEKGIEITSRDGKREDVRWKRIFAEIGEQTLEKPAAALEAIHAGLDRYADERREAGVKVQSIKRECTRTLSALRSASKKYRFGWVIEPNYKGLPSDPKQDKIVLSEAEQIATIKYCLADTKTPELSACVVLMMQSGAMVSEIGRMDWNETRKDLVADVPQVCIGKGGKTQDRHRVIPIVFGRDFLLEHLQNAITLCGSRTDSNLSHRVKKLLVTATDNRALSAHCLRHTVRANGDIVNANPSHVAAICGWANSNKPISKSMMNYGREALSRAEGFKAVRDTSIKMHRHIIDVLAESESNVVPLQRKG